MVRWTGSRRRSLVAAFALLLAACSSRTAGRLPAAVSGSTSSKPLVIGISLSLTGDFSDPGKAAKKGYQLWADSVNAKGGILGRQVELKIVDDASSPNQVITNYENLITKDKVDLVSRAILHPAERPRRHRWPIATTTRSSSPPAADPTCSTRSCRNVFFVQPAPSLNCGSPSWTSSCPCRPISGPRPRPTRRSTTPSRLRSPTRCGRSSRRWASRPSTSKIYPAETAGSHADRAGDGRDEPGHGRRRHPVRVTRTRRSRPWCSRSSTRSSCSWPTVRARRWSSPTKVGASQHGGHLQLRRLVPELHAERQPRVRRRLHREVRRRRLLGIDSTSAEAYAAGQLLQQAVAAKTGYDRQPDDHQHAALRDLAHGRGRPELGPVRIARRAVTCSSNGSSGKLLPVYPPDVALHAPVYPKPNWGG